MRKYKQDIVRKIKKGKFELKKYRYCDYLCEQCTNNKKCLLSILIKQEKVIIKNKDKFLPLELQKRIKLFYIANRYIQYALYGKLIKKSRVKIKLPKDYQLHPVINPLQQYSRLFYEFLKSQDFIQDGCGLVADHASLVEKLAWRSPMLSSKIIKVLNEAGWNRFGLKNNRKLFDTDFQLAIKTIIGIIDKIREDLISLTEKHLCNYSCLKQIVRLIIKLDTIKFILKDNFGFPVIVNILPPQFNEPQVKILEKAQKNLINAHKIALKYFLKHPYDNRMVIILGELLSTLENEKEAADFFELATLLNPNDYFIHFSFGLALSRIGRFNHSLSILSRAWELNEDDISVSRALAWTMVMCGFFQGKIRVIRDGIAVLEDLIENNNIKDYTIMVDLTHAYMITGKSKDAYRWIMRAKKIAPKDNFVVYVYKHIKNLKNKFPNQASLDKMLRQTWHSKKIEKRLKNMNIIEVDDYTEKRLQIDSIVSYLTKEPDINTDLILSGKIIKDIKKIKEINFDEGFKLKELKVSQAKMVVEYISWRNNFKHLQKKLNNKEMEFYLQKFIQGKTMDIKKEIVLIIAYQGNKNALSILQEIRHKTRGNLRFWVDLAINECLGLQKKIFQSILYYNI